MSIWSKFGSFFEAVGTEIEKLFGASSLEQKAQAVISYVAPVVNTIVGLLDPAVAPLVAGVISAVQSDLATISVVVQSATAAPGSTAAQTIKTAITGVNTNLNGILQMAEVKNSAKIAQITSAVTLISGELNALLTNLPS